MKKTAPAGKLCIQRARLCASLWLTGAVCFCAAGCGPRQSDRIAFLPQTEGAMIWHTAHVDAEESAHRHGAFVYWNAPTREDDVEGQIAIVDRVADSGYTGLGLAPAQVRALVPSVGAAGGGGR